MPTPGGLPKRGEVWERTARAPGQPTTVTRFVVLARGGGAYWSLTVRVPGRGRQLWVDASAWFAWGELAYIGPAPPPAVRK